MQLSVTCPRCQSKYQLDAAMRDKKMRCPNTICRAIFEVRDDNDPPAPAAEAVKPIEAKPEPPPAVVPPTVEVKKPEPVKRKPIPIPVEPPPAADFPDDFPGDEEAAPAPSSPAVSTEAWQPEAHDAPPLREVVVAPPEPVARRAPKLAPADPAPRKSRRALWAIGAMLLVLGLLAGGAYWRIVGGMASNEAERFQKAEEMHKEHRYADAAAAFQNLQRDFPASEHAKKYRFLAELSDVRHAVASCQSADDADKALGRVIQFTGAHADEPILKERGVELWQMLDTLAGELTRLAGQEKRPQSLARARQAWEAAKAYPAPPGANKGEREQGLNAEWTRIEQILTAHAERQDIVATLRKLLEQPNAAAIQEGQMVVEKSKRGEDTEIRGLLDDLVKAHRAQVKFVFYKEETTPALPKDDDFPSLSVTPLVVAPERERETSKELVVALARGVLYALEPAKGELRWVRRVGIDTNVLPVRVPTEGTTPEMLVVVSSDQRSMAGVNAQTGETLWQTRLSEACVGRPVLVDRSILAATLAGRIDEVELATGRLTGSYTVGQPLTLGGVRQPGTPFVYFPADEFCLYVIDVTKRTCPSILYTRHPAGSLRGLPAIVATDKGGTLLWTQTRGPNRVEIKPYELPIEDPEQKPAEPIVLLPGLSAPPWVGPDRLAAATQTGVLSVWGVKQKGTRDPLLFRLFKQDLPVDERQHVGRCEVVHADAESYWTMFGGKLQRIQSMFDPKTGPKLLPLWTEPILLGTPLHAPEARPDADGRTILYLTTQADEHGTCWCTAVDADAGKIIWQRQLGALPQQQPVIYDGKVFLRDTHGLLRFDPGESAKNLGGHWRPGGARLFHLSGTGAAAPSLVNKDQHVYLAWSSGTDKLHLHIGSLAGNDKGRTLDVKLAARLQGTPALGDGFLLVPLADGLIYRIDLDDSKKNATGPDWRVVGAEDHARGHLVMVSPTDFVLTDGSSGLERRSGADFARKAQVKLAHRITGPPVILGAGLAIADASDLLTLLDAERLTERETWQMPAKITAGPFERKGQIGCVVGKTRLVFVHPDKKEIAWEYTTLAGIVGEPQLIGADLVVADVAGRFVALDPANGRPRGDVFTLKANVAATAAPVPFGSGQAFVPLTDGTIILLPMEKLRTSP